MKGPTKFNDSNMYSEFSQSNFDKHVLTLFTELGQSLFEAKNHYDMLEATLLISRKITNCDGGTVYLLNTKYSDNQFTPRKIEDKFLNFEVMQNESMGVFLRRDKNQINIPPVKLLIDGQPNKSNVSAYCANFPQIINISDVYSNVMFDFTGTKAYDKNFNYHSKSMLVFPLKNNVGEPIGVFQLINKKSADNELIPFSEFDSLVLSSISVMMGLILSVSNLYLDQKELFDSLIRLIAKNIEAKSPHTFDHINKVTTLSGLIVEALNDSHVESKKLNNSEIEELRIAALLHDIGKIAIPEHVIGKSKKLQFLCDRLEVIFLKLESHFKDIKINLLERKAQEPDLDIEKEYFNYIKSYNKHLKLLFLANQASEAMDDSMVKAINTISSLNYKSHYSVVLSKDMSYVKGIKFSKSVKQFKVIDQVEQKNLLINKGSLNPEEIEIMRSHAQKSWDLLKALPFPEELRAIPLYAGSHHELLDGTGYPYKIDGNKMPLQSRILVIADIFEALSSKSRPYRDAYSVEKFMSILGDMAKNGKIDKDVLKIFVSSKFFEFYINEYLSPEQGKLDYETWLNKFYVSD